MQYDVDHGRRIRSEFRRPPEGNVQPFVLPISAISGSSVLSRIRERKTLFSAALAVYTISGFPATVRMFFLAMPLDPLRAVTMPKTVGCGL